MSAPRASAATVSTTVQIPAITVVAPPPELVSQRNVEAVTGLPSRTFLEIVRVPGFPLRVTRIGKLRVVDRAAFVDHIRGLADREHVAAASGVERMAEELGLQRSPSPRRSS